MMVKALWSHAVKAWLQVNTTRQAGEQLLPLSENGAADPFLSTSSLRNYGRIRSHCFTLTGALHFAVLAPKNESSNWGHSPIKTY